MVTIARNRRSRVLSGALAVLLAAPNAFANSLEVKDFASLAEILKTGDVIAVTPWSGKKLKGRLVEVTECSIRLRTDGKALSLAAGAVKTVRRYPPQQRAAKVTWGAVEQCDRLECAPTTLAVIGVAALVKSFRDAGGAKIVYRGRPDPAAARALNPFSRSTSETPCHTAARACVR
jgi:hypothetical protein